MNPPDGLKIVLNTGTVLIRCTPISTGRRQTQWGLWAGTVVVRGSAKFRVGQRYLYHETAVVKTFKHGDPFAPKRKPKDTFYLPKRKKGKT